MSYRGPVIDLEAFWRRALQDVEASGGGVVGVTVIFDRAVEETEEGVYTQPSLASTPHRIEDLPAVLARAIEGLAAGKGTSEEGAIPNRPQSPSEAEH